MYLLNGRYGVVDLAFGEAKTIELDAGYSKTPSSMLSMMDSAMAEAGGDAFAIASGLLAGSLVPAACAGFVRLPHSTGEGAASMCPLLGFTGVELKLSGFDFVIVSGDADQSGYLWIRDGIIEFVPSPGITDKDAWELTDKIRTDQGDGRIQVLATGPWAESQPAASQLVANYWGGEDKTGCAGEFRRRKLCALAFRGMGELELESPDEHLESSVALARSHLEMLGENQGLASFTDAAAGEDYAELLHRNVSCYGCPFPCRSYYRLSGDPQAMSPGNDEPGYLVFDIAALERLSSAGLGTRDAVKSLMVCARIGAEPLSVLEAMVAGGLAIDPDSVSSFLASDRLGEAAVANSAGKGFDATFDNPTEYNECLLLGLCPRYWSKVGYDREAISKAAASTMGAGHPLL